MDEHEDKVWSVTVNKEEDHIVTGGADSSIILWKVGSCNSHVINLHMEIIDS